MSLLKKIITAILIASMIISFSSLAVSALTDDTIQAECILNVDIPDEDSLPDSDELLMGYLEQDIYPSLSLFGRSAYDLLNDNEKIMSNSIWFTKEGTEKMMRDGYDRAREVLDLVFAEGKEDLSKIYSKIRELDALNPNKKLRVTVDVAIHNLNKMMKLISKRRIVE